MFPVTGTRSPLCPPCSLLTGTRSPLPPVSPGRRSALPRWQQQAAGLGPGRPRAQSLPCGTGGWERLPKSGGSPGPAMGYRSVAGGQRDACCLPLSPIPFNGDLVWVMGQGMRGAGGAGGGSSSPPCCRERKPAASSAVTGTRVLLLLLLSAAAALPLHPIIIRGGCEKRKTQTQHTQANNPPQLTVPPSPRSVGLAGPAALPWPWGGEAEPGRRGKEGAGARQTQGISLLSPARRAAQGLGAAAAGAPRSPLRSRRHRGGAAGLRGSAPGSGQLAGSSFPPSSPSLGVISAFSA